MAVILSRLQGGIDARRALLKMPLLAAAVAFQPGIASQRRGSAKLTNAL